MSWLGGRFYRTAVSVGIGGKAWTEKDRKDKTHLILARFVVQFVGLDNRPRNPHRWIGLAKLCIFQQQSILAQGQSFGIAWIPGVRLCVLVVRGSSWCCSGDFFLLPPSVSHCGC